MITPKNTSIDDLNDLISDMIHKADLEYDIENSGIGAYEYSGYTFVDRGHDYLCLYGLKEPLVVWTAILDPNDIDELLPAITIDIDGFDVGCEIKYTFKDNKIFIDIEQID